MNPWICPRCQTVWAGWVACCTCRPMQQTFSGTSTATVRCTCAEPSAPPPCPIHDRQMTFTVLESS